MSNEQPKRTYRTKEERIREIDQKIAYHKICIETLERRKEKMNDPISRTRKPSLSSLQRIVKEQDVDPAAAMEALKAAGLIQ